VWILGVAAAAFALALVVVLIVGRSDRPDPCDAPRTAPPAETSLMPAGLSFDRIGPVTRVRKEGSHVVARAVSTKPIDELTVLIQDAVTAAGYGPAGMDNEGFEAEVFFTAGPYAAGQALVRATACAGRWDIDLVLLDRDAAPRARASSPRSP
jgi:hypothetical protein